MNMEMRFCEYCGGAIYPDDVAPVKIEVDGVIHQFHYHNSLAQPCLKMEIERLKQHFAAPQQ
jgi:hypothetical protein